MKTKKNASLRVAAFATLAISFGLLAFTNASATGNINKAKKMTTFVGGDIHTLTFTKSGLFVTGHEAGSLSTNAGMRWKSIPSFKNADIMGWATTDLGYLGGTRSAPRRNMFTWAPHKRAFFVPLMAGKHGRL